MNSLGQRIAGEKLKRYGAIGGSLLLLGGVIVGGQRLGEAYTYSSRVDTIEEKIEEKDFLAASRLLAEFGKKGMLKLEDKVLLELKIQRGKEVYSITTLLREGKGGEAGKRAASLRKKGIIPPSITIPGENQESLYRSLVAADAKEKEGLATLYLKAYPQGENRKDVIKQLIVGSATVLSRLMEQHAPYKKVYAQTVKVNDYLRKYQHHRINFSEIVNGGVLTKLSSDYAKIAHHLQNSKPHVGGWVRINENATKAGAASYGRDIYNERERAIKVGSVGKLIEIDGTSYVVRFPFIKKFYWSDDSSPESKYWKKPWKEKGNTAEYVSKSLTPIILATSIEKANLMQEIKKIEAFLKAYK